MAQPPITLVANDTLLTANFIVNDVTVHSLENLHLIQGPNKDIWSHSIANDLVRLAQGVETRMPNGTNTVFPRRCDIPASQRVT